MSSSYIVDVSCRNGYGYTGAMFPPCGVVGVWYCVYIYIYMYIIIIINGLTPWCRRPLLMVLGTDRVACACAQDFLYILYVCIYIYIYIYIK